MYNKILKIFLLSTNHFSIDVGNFSVLQNLKNHAPGGTITLRIANDQEDYTKAIVSLIQNPIKAHLGRVENPYPYVYVRKVATELAP